MDTSRTLSNAVPFAVTNALTLPASGAVTLTGLAANLPQTTGVYTLFSYGSLTAPQAAGSNLNAEFTGLPTFTGKTVSVIDTNPSGSGLVELQVANSVTPTTYTLSASAAGGSLTNGRLTSGQSATVTGTVTNTGTGTADTLNYTGLAVSPAGAVTPSSGGPLAQGASGTGTASYTFVTPGSITLTPSVATATNATLTGSATLGGTTTASVTVDAIAEHTSTLNDTGFASSSSTSAYRQNYVAGGNLGR